MRDMQRLSAIVLAVTLAVACSSRPTEEVDAARGARDKAAAANASQYAAESMAAAESAQAALDAELAAQDARWMKSYDRTRELAAAARAASDKAAADAVAGRERAEATARAAAAKAKADADMRAKLATTAVRAGGAVRPVKTKDAMPVYPSVAKSARLGGTVQVELTVDPEGKVADARIVKSVPLLDQAALDAVKQWEYTPTRVKGVAVPVLVNVAINFQP